MAFTDRLHNRGSLSTGYDIDNSLKLEADNAEYLYYTPSGQTDYERMAFSIWVKRTELGDGNLAEFGNGTSNTSNLRIGFDSNDKLFCYGNSIVWRQTNQVFRDTSAWYHLFFLFDTTTPGGISNNRIRIWVNGSMIAHTDFGVINNPGSGAAMGFNNSLQQSIGAQREGGPTNYFKGYIAQAYGSGGTPPVVGDFGETDANGIWIPKDISELTPPDAAGFNLDFSDAANLGNDISSRNNDFTLQNITSADQATDTPTNNFVTWLSDGTLFNIGSDNMLFVEGGTRMLRPAGTGWTTHYANMAASSGKWYFEHESAGANNTMMGAIPVEGTTDNTSGRNNHYLGNVAGHGVGYQFIDRYVYQNGSYALNGGNNPNSGTIVQVALDLDNGKIYFGLDNTWITAGTGANPSTGSNGNSLSGWSSEQLWMFAGSTYNPNVQQSTNFGGYTEMSISSAASDANGYGTFEYAPPTGFYALCTKNLAEYG